MSEIGCCQVVKKSSVLCQHGRKIGFPVTVCRFAMGGIFTTNVIRSTKLSATTKLSAEHETPPIANVLLAAGQFNRGYLFRNLVHHLHVDETHIFSFHIPLVCIHDYLNPEDL